MDIPRLGDRTTQQLMEQKALDLTRYIACLGEGGSPRLAAAEVLQRWPGAIHADLFHKVAVASGDTTHASWAGPLAVVQPLVEGFVQMVRTSSVIGKLGLRRVPLLSSVPVETTATSFAWTGEGAPKVVSAGGFGLVSLLSAKAAGILALSNELVRLARPGTDVALRDALVAGMGSFVNTEFGDSTIAATATRPGGVANGSPTAAATAAPATDIKAMVNAFIAVNPNLEDAAFVMAPNVAISVAIATGSDTLLATGGSLYGVPVVTTAAAGTTITLLDTSQAIFGDDPPGVVIDMSQHATLMLDSVPSNPTVASDVFHSLWQRNMTAIKTEYPIRWKLVRTDAARTLTGVSYV